MEGTEELNPSRPSSREMHASLVGFSSRYRQSLHEGIARGEVAEIQDALWNRVWLSTMEYLKNGYSMATLELHVHDIWYSCYLASKHLSHETAGHDRLGFYILRFRAIGPLKRPAKQNHQDIEVAETSAGVLWEDLPFLVTDMTDYWINDCATIDDAQRCNFARFLAKLASADVCRDRLFQIALVTMRDALETPRPLGSRKSPNAENAERTIKDLTVADLLPAVYAWVQEARYKMVPLANELWNDCDEQFGRGGPIFLESELGKKSTSGFSHWRWMFWLKRLDDIKQEAKEAGENDIAELITDIHDLMTGPLEDGLLQIFQKFEAAGDLIPNRNGFGIRYLIDRHLDEWKEANPDSDTEEADQVEKSLDVPQIREDPRPRMTEKTPETQTI